MSPPPTSLYLHIPFCLHRCSYCDFNTYAGLEALMPAYVEALCSEIEYAGQSAGEHLPVHTIFFGGGTPSLLPPAQVARILQAIERAFERLPGSEITLEANPGTLSPAHLADLRRLGVNRLSLGMQSAHPGELHLLERQHDYLDVIHAVSWARQAGFENINLDLIFGLPEQTLQTWQHSLELALGLHPEHLSLYSLTIEHGTPFGRWLQRGLLSEPDSDAAADMYEWAGERLEHTGYTQYEISNWGRDRLSSSSRLSILNPDFACRHNLQYWRGQPYLGLGAGAHGYARSIRTATVLAPAAYIERMKAAPAAEPAPFPRTPATQSAHFIERDAEIGETMMMGLRLTQEGVREADFRARFGQGLEDVFGAQIKKLAHQGLLEWKEGVLRLTRRGRLLGNRVFVEFI